MPIVATVSEAAGVAHVLATDAVVLDTDTQGVGVQWSETSNSDDFAKNLIRARCESRFGTSFLSPLGVVSCDLDGLMTAVGGTCPNSPARLRGNTPMSSTPQRAWPGASSG